MTFDPKSFDKQLAVAAEWLTKEFQQIRTGQASPAVLDPVKVESYGTPTALKEVASITIEGARTMRVSPWDKSLVKEIEKAITAANLGLSVVADQEGLRVNFPELTTDRRKEIVKNAKEKLEEARKQVRMARDRTVRELQDKEKDGDMGKDDAFRAKNEVQKTVDAANKKLDELFAKKEHDILD
ncbi:ribosome recycling factor [Patescibacteria group bacterium]|nr:ribosome recycling factor [Patescibacteria group bacterium]MDE1946562.1 ribosome recycling factor [Patescibacteria group bacterium]MDE2010877.1 ribosome recycling factor [Patescibacteria group bacterium]MDE2232761.1 ribosome recycling factor [Patescibacteria group bacterium]